MGDFLLQDLLAGGYLNFLTTCQNWRPKKHKGVWKGSDSSGIGIHAANRPQEILLSAKPLNTNLEFQSNLEIHRLKKSVETQTLNGTPAPSPNPTFKNKRILLFLVEQASMVQFCASTLKSTDVMFEIRSRGEHATVLTIQFWGFWGHPKRGLSYFKIALGVHQPNKP